MFNKNLTAEIPLVLGTVPLYNPLQAGTMVPSPSSTTPTPGSMNVLPPSGPIAAGYGQPGFPAQPPTLGFNPDGPIPMADGTYTGPSPQNGGGYAPQPTQPGAFGGPVPQPMYPQPVYPDLSLEKLGPGFNVVGGLSPTAPPQGLY